MSARCIVLFFVVLELTLHASLGDQFVQKAGPVVEGVAIEQDESQFIVRPYLGDDKTVTLLRTEVTEVLPDSQETADFLALREESAIRTAVTPAQFAELLERKIPAFQSKYPSTRYRPELDRMLDELKADQLRLTNGSVKIAGLWLDHDQLNLEKYQVSAAMLQEAMASAEARGDWISALNAFQNLKANFAASRAYVDGIEIAARVLPRLGKLEEQKLQQYRLNLLQLSLSLTETPSHIRADLERADRRESESVEAAIADQRATGVRWPTVVPRSETGFEEMFEQIAQEEAALAKLPRNKYRTSVNAAIKAIESAAKRDLASAQSCLKTAEEMWPENEMLPRISASIEQARQARQKAIVQPIARAQPEQGLILGKNYPRIICIACAGFCFLLAAILYLRRVQRSRRRYIG
jgi:hypothetical protein